MRLTTPTLTPTHSPGEAKKKKVGTESQRHREKAHCRFARTAGVAHPRGFQFRVSNPVAPPHRYASRTSCLFEEPGINHREHGEHREPEVFGRRLKAGGPERAQRVDGLRDLTQGDGHPNQSHRAHQRSESIGAWVRIRTPSTSSGPPAWESPSDPHASGSVVGSSASASSYVTVWGT